jgi:ankyrin repeat protein
MAMLMMHAELDEFSHAAEADDVDAMRRLLDCPSADAAAMMRHKNGGCDTALQSAAYFGNVAAVRLLLDHPSADAAAMMMIDRGVGGATALIQAAQTCEVSVMHLLLDHPSADPAVMIMQTDDVGESALVHAAWHDGNNDDLAGRVAAMSFLLDHPSVDPAEMMMHSGMAALKVAAWSGNLDAMRLLLEHPSADPAAMIKHADSNGRTALLEAAEASWNLHFQVATMRLLLDHPSADPEAMLMHADGSGATALTLATSHGNVDAMRLLLDHPSADPAAMIAIRSPGGASALTAAATCAVGEDFTLGDSTRPCAPYRCGFTPLLLLLRLTPVESQQARDAQQAHMSKVMEALCEGPLSQALFDSDQPNDERDECIRLLMERAGADIFADTLHLIRPVVLRIFRELSQLARVPQLVNEAVVGIALARQQAKPRPNAE